MAEACGAKNRKKLLNKDQKNSVSDLLEGAHQTARKARTAGSKKRQNIGGYHHCHHGGQRDHHSVGEKQRSGDQRGRGHGPTNHTGKDGQGHANGFGNQRRADHTSQPTVDCQVNNCRYPTIKCTDRQRQLGKGHGGDRSRRYSPPRAIKFCYYRYLRTHLIDPRTIFWAVYGLLNFLFIENLFFGLVYIC